MKKIRNMVYLAVAFLSTMGLVRCGTPSHVSGSVEYVNPGWAPPYYAGVRYYYLPDLETYYDLSDREFIYLDNGQWLFSPVLPSLYSGYDLYTGFVIALHTHAFEPWRHHDLYLAHYPRYYYRSLYGKTGWTSLRGFNENSHQPFYWKPGDRDRRERGGKQDIRPPDRNLPHPPEQPRYYGKKIGQPVRITPGMKKERGKAKRGNE